MAQRKAVKAERQPQAPRKKPPEQAGLHVAMVSPEIAPFAKTGGLADAVSGLALALEKLGFRVTLIMPAYRTALKGDFLREEMQGMAFTVPVSDRKEPATVLKATLGQNIATYLIRADKYFDRDHLYATRDGDYPDNSERFAFFSRAVLEVLRTDPPQILHCHDWQSTLAIVFAKNLPSIYPELRETKTVLTVHNLGYQGLFKYQDWHLLNLDRSLFNIRGLEFYGKISFLKGGIVYADAITTVSPTYAEEIKSPEQGFGLEGVFRERAQSVVGIINGADYSQWNPKTDPFIAQNYDAKDLSRKAECKSDLQRAFKLPESHELPLLGMITRLTSQKGLDILEKALDDLLSRDLQFVLLGSGERSYEDLFREAVSRYPGKAGVCIGFDEPLAHRIEAGADLFLMPSLYEPCGLNQMYSMKYGTIPIVRATGGLKDTVQDYTLNGRSGNGFVFESYDPAALLDAVDRALALFKRKSAWNALVKRTMKLDFSWDRSAQSYAALYRRLVS